MAEAALMVSEREVLSPSSLSPLPSSEAVDTPKPKPFILFDVKGACWERGKGCEEPLEVGLVVARSLHGKVLNEASFHVSYPKEDLKRIRLHAHASLLDEGGAMDCVDSASYWKPVFEASYRSQIAQFFVKEAFLPLVESGYVAGDVYLPVWNLWYEEACLPHSTVWQSHNYRPRPIEMSDVSAMLVEEFGLAYPERGEWNSLESLRWYHGRMRELFPKRRKRK